MTERKVLIDSNILINAVKSEQAAQTDDQRDIIRQAKQRLRQVLTADDVALVITPLVRYEVLRHSKDEQERARLAQILQVIPVFEISREIGDLATRLYPLKVKVDMNANKYNFDIFHFATAKILDCEITTHDNGFAQLELIYSQLQANIEKI